MTRYHALAALLLIALAPLVAAQERVTGANYPLAQKFSKEFVAQHAREASVSPQWIGKTDVFWYSARTASGAQYWKVDPAKLERTPLFDHSRLAAALSEASKQPLDADTFRMDRVSVTPDGKKLNFVFGEGRYEYDLEAGKLKSLGKAPPTQGGMSPEAIERMRGQLGDERVNEMLRRMREGETDTEKKDDTKKDDTGKGGMQPPANPGGPGSYKNYSPDKKKYAYVYKFNLYLCDEGQPEDKATQLSTDGADEYSFGGFGGFGGAFNKGGNDGSKGATSGDRKTRANVTWSPDSKAFYVTRTDSRGIKDLYLVDSIATPRPKLEQYKYPMPAEAEIRKTELYYCDTEKKALTKVSPKWRDERYSDVRWGKGPGELRFIRRDRLRRNLEVCAFDVFSGQCKCMFGEGFEAAYLETQSPRYLEETDEFIWWSERSGWGHFYRYGRDGTFKNAITSGPWRASRIVEVDAKAGFVYLIGNARESGENPYYTHTYRVKLDGTGLTCLDPSDRMGQSVERGLNQTSTLSPSKKFVVTNSTAVDRAPFAVVRDDTGKSLMLLETTDLSALEKAGWKMPETFSVKAADGTTDLYGNMWKPFDFDPKKQYPVIAHVYPGPQTEGVVYRFSAYSTNMQLAQLGFVVIQVGHRGGSPERSKAYHSFGYFNLRDYGLVDKKAAIEALAARHSFLDVSRVGIFGHSGGGFMSAAALLQKPYNDFFKVAVASAGNHDNNIYNDNWSETYHGLKEVPVATEKGEKKEGSTGSTGAGTGGKGFGGRKKGPAEEELIEEELIELMQRFDPEDQRSVEELEAQITALKARLARLQQAEAAKSQLALAPPPRLAGTKPPLASAAAAVVLPLTKFEIKVPTNAELADNLKGHLLLVHGEIDNNVHPANTMRLVDALIKANKRFDLLIIPGARHGFGVAQPYFNQRMWDFFAEHLLGDRQTGADINIKDVKRK
ncbi:DPP IV N-terminal domain-containing protein [Gemmata sp. JC717]|uniref:DPP IV N-terminal domain-containing protein n=1 Tax=Gemmata algarum TaxID=2975278 RepID=A0ABU5F6D0_9BACT|nr:DPP IV N-terminal domain-containing protein [Gemmata algarum]MDY3555472.1 DPP IV N-terminal domain-containing protein [Gemmata algarum]MDY3563136.1 DPP IV N-terminal domain-containing protein [Gemmata algarum]